jgi:hypothetical protein
MPYNDKYFFEFDTLKTANKVTKYYRVVFSKLEDITVTYDLVQLTPSNSPFVLSYRSPEDNAFSPIKTSSAEINILYPYDANADVPQPEIFLNNTQEAQWLVRFYEITSNGAVTALKWQGYLLNDVQYEWQDAYYYRLVATDNLAVLKDVKYSDDTEFKFPDYVPLDGVTVKDFIIDLVNKTGSLLNYKFAWTMYNNSNELKLENMFTSKYNMVDWKTFLPKNIYPVLEDLLKTLGCILYLDNADGAWTILHINEIGTRTDNEVPYDMYDSHGVFVSSGDLSLNSSINKGETDLVWRDKNQIVSFLKPIGGVKMTCDYVPKNLLTNYSFQEDLSHTGWADNGTFDSEIEVGTAPFFGTGYDNNYLDIDSSESNLASLDVSNYFYQNLDLTGTPLVAPLTGTRPNAYSVLVQFKSYAKPENSLCEGEGFNFQLWSVDRSNNIRYYDTTNILANRTNGGQWAVGAGAGVSRMAVFSDFEQPYNQVSLFTRGVALYDRAITMRLVFLKYRYDFYNTSSGEYKLDTVRLCLCNQYRYLDKFMFNAFSNPKFTIIDKKSQFTGGFNKTDWYLIEGCVTRQVGTGFECNKLWDRHFEQHDEATFNYLDAVEIKSQLSFYRNISRKFTGNVYGEQISYPKYFEIEKATDNQVNIDIANAFKARILADIGECEDVYCGSNYLNEFSVNNAKFLMIEATFDYQQSTTAVNLHEDLTNVNEVGFEANFAGLQQGSGQFPNQYGISTDADQEPETIT